MRLDKSFLTSKVARRIFILFVLCALVPMFILAGITFTSVNDQLTDQAMMRLRQNCKIKGLEIYGNLSFLDMELRMVASRVKDDLSKNLVSGRPDPAKSLVRGFRNLGLETGEGGSLSLLGSIKEAPKLTEEERRHLSIGRTLVSVFRDAKGVPGIILSRLLDPDRPERGIILGDVEPSQLWGVEVEESLPSEVQTFILEPKGELLYSSVPDLEFSKEVRNQITRHPGSGSFFFEHKGGESIAGYWSLFLKYHFQMPHFTIVMSQSRSAVLEPVAYFTKLFFLFILLTFLVVCLLSVVLIRKSLVPIEILRKGTERIASGEFGIEVNIQSGDEFESLGDAFNHMSQKLQEGRAMLVQSAKMGAVGQMAAGIVHEIGQPLTSISGLMDLSMMDKPSERVEKRLKMMKSEMERLTGIISRFKNFARVTEGKLIPLSINEVVDSTYVLLEHQLQMKRVYCDVKKTGDLPMIMGDKNSLLQVLINLIINAMDALEEKKQERSTIDVSTFLSGDAVCVSIQDNGPGIPKEIRERIFEPFFTTKKPGKGTGLGLAIIESILHQHKAKIALETEVGKGTMFTIAFPGSGS